MQEDIAAVKKGQAPAGFQIEKQSEKDITPPPVGAPGPKITMPPRPAPEIRLGELEKAKSLPSTKLPSFPPMPTVPPAGPAAKPAGLSVPTGGGINKKGLIFLAAGLVVIAFLVWFFALRGPSAPEVTVSPTPVYTVTVTPTPTPVSIENSFSITDSASIALGANFTTRFNAAINQESLKSPGEVGLYRIFNPSTGKEYTFREFLNGLLIQPPAEVLEFIPDSGSFYLSAVHKSDGKNGFGLIVKLKEGGANTALENWEGTMTQDLKDLFGLDPIKAVSTTFLDNIYQGVPIKYRNFPNPNLTIDYAVMLIYGESGNGPNGERASEDYLIITNSREHMYSVIDKIK